MPSEFILLYYTYIQSSEDIWSILAKNITIFSLCLTAFQLLIAIHNFDKGRCPSSSINSVKCLETFNVIFTYHSYF